jgi:hypothetical protein
MLLVQLTFMSHPAVYQMIGIFLSDFDVVVPCLRFQNHLELDVPCDVVNYLLLCAIDALAEIMATVLRDLLNMGCSFENL